MASSAELDRMAAPLTKRLRRAEADAIERLSGDEALTVYRWALKELARYAAAIRGEREDWDVGRKVVAEARERRGLPPVQRRLRGPSGKLVRSYRRERVKLLTLRDLAREDLRRRDNAWHTNVAERHEVRSEAAAKRLQAARREKATRRRELLLREISAIRSDEVRYREMRRALRYEEKRVNPDSLLVAALERRMHALLEKTLQRSRDCCRSAN